MKKPPRLFPSGNTLYCDDIRVEVNNKLSFIGVYPGKMIVFSHPPVNITQLCAFIVLWLEPSEVPAQLTAKLIFVGDSGIERDLWETTVSPTRPNPADFSASSPDAQPHVEWRIAAQLTHVFFEESGYIKSRVYYDGNEVRLGVLEIGFEPSQA